MKLARCTTRRGLCPRGRDPRCGDHGRGSRTSRIFTIFVFPSQCIHSAKGYVLRGQAQVTLADDSVDTDTATRMMANSKYFAVVVLVAGFTTIAVANVGLKAFVGMVAGLAIFLQRWSKQARVNLSGKDTELPRIVAGIRARKLPSTGSVVLRCPRDSDLWRQIVLDLSQTVDAAVVSAAEDSPNVDWEIRTLSSRLGPHKIIVLLDEANGTHLVPPQLATAGIIHVPANMRWWPGLRPWRSAEITLGSAILVSKKVSPL